MTQRLYAYENATAKTTMPDAVSAPGSPGLRRTTSAPAITLRITTNTSPWRRVVTWKHIGSSAKARNQALAFWLWAAVNKTTSPAR